MASSPRRPGTSSERGRRGAGSTGLGLAADLVLHNGNIWTGEPTQPDVAGVAVAAGRIVGLGPSDAVLALAGPATRTIDLMGCRVVPGIIDAHVHFLAGGEELLAADLRGARCEDELGQRLHSIAAALPAGTWITSGRWDHESWPGQALPHRATLDRYTPEHPVLVRRLDGHMAVANSLALRLAGVDAHTADPPGGTLVRDAGTGVPTGVLKDQAMDIVSRHVPAPTREQMLQRARAAAKHAAQLGVTSVHDMLESYDALRVYQELKALGELTVRVTAYTPIDSVERWAGVGVGRGFGDEQLRLNGVKAFADGSLGSSTALFLEPYADAESFGLAVMDLSPGGVLETLVRQSLSARLQPATHAIGDRAIRSVLDIYERVGVEAVGEQRPRIEHAQHLHPQDIARFAALGVIASMQPYHALDDGRWAEHRIGARRCDTTYAFRDLLDSGTRVAFGSDWPVAPLSPWEGLYAAVTRATPDGQNPLGWIPRQKISVEEALRAYTAGSAHAGFAEQGLGTLAVDKLADLVVLDRDILTVPPDQLRDTEVLLTVAGGQVVHDLLPSGSGVG